MKKSFPLWLSVVLLVLYLLHNDLWYWTDARLVLGIPIGLFYHIAFCVAASLMMTAFVKLGWPSHLEIEDNEEVKS